MSKIQKVKDNEPVMLAGAVAAVMNSAIALSTAFEWYSFTTAQEVAVNGFVASLILLFNFFARNKVTPI